MERFSHLFHSLFLRLLPSRATHSSIEISRMDAYLNSIYKILIWEDPKISFMTLGVLHVLLWLIVQLELRFYGIIFIAFLMIFLCDFYFERKELKAERSSTMRQIRCICQNYVLYLRRLRKENPSVFCVVMCTLFLSLTVVARNVPGFVLAYIALMATFTGPFLISRLPSEYLDSFKGILETFTTNEGLLAESELLPYISTKNLNEQDPDLDSLLTDRTADSITNSLISGITCMPSYLDAEGGSLDGLDEAELEFTMKSNNEPVISFTPGENSSDSDSDHKSMNFESSHFNRDSSSEDENYYMKGLRFSEVNKDFTDASKSQKSNSENISPNVGILNNLSSLGSSLIANVLKTTATNTPERKDSDSDFEIIDSEEIDES